MPPSPVVVEMPARFAAMPSAFLALPDSAPYDMPAIVIGRSEHHRVRRERVPSTVLVSHFSR